jgi:hypothetical protein
MASQPLGLGRGYFRRLNPFRALRDLRMYLHARKPHEIGFLFLSAAICSVVVSVFVIDSHLEKPYIPPTIIYVQSWRADRTDAQIMVQQKIDQAKKEADDAKLKKLQEQRQAEFKRFNDKVLPWL